MLVFIYFSTCVRKMVFTEDMVVFNYYPFDIRVGSNPVRTYKKTRIARHPSPYLVDSSSSLKNPTHSDYHHQLRLRAKMSATLTGSGTALGFSCSSKISKRVSPSSPSTRCSVKMSSVSVDEKKKSFTLQKSEEAFNAAKVSVLPRSVLKNPIFDWFVVTKCLVRVEMVCKGLTFNCSKNVF